MPLVDVDVTKAGLVPDGDYVVTVQKLNYQVKVGDKWNKAGTEIVDFEKWKDFDAETKRLQYILVVPEKGNLFHELYVKPSALRFVKDFLKAAGVGFTPAGFNPEEAVGKTIGITVTTEDDAEYGPQNRISKVYAP